MRCSLCTGEIQFFQVEEMVDQLFDVTFKDRKIVDYESSTMVHSVVTNQYAKCKDCEVEVTL